MTTVRTVLDLMDERPVGRIGTPQDIGNEAVFLALPEAAYINGVTLRVDAVSKFSHRVKIQQKYVGASSSPCALGSMPTIIV